uniref:Nucleolar transcription factor 1-like n=1 Tax=Elaeis guineensis var. tenera TaxID=51953 RepID=A0A8N4F366_ELAGV|nr:nucleolar transcription factor 1-like [Elaeis guineensis]
MSWLDVNECFDVDEKPNNRTRKRGPRNLNVDNKGKGKEKIIEEDIEVIEEDEGNEEEEEEEENQKMIMLKDDDDGGGGGGNDDISLGDDYDD